MVSVYTGTLIDDLFAVVERAETSARLPRLQSTNPRAPQTSSDNFGVRKGRSESEQFPQTLGLSPADGNLGLFLVVHAQLVGTLEPGHDFADAVHVYEI